MDRRGREHLFEAKVKMTVDQLISSGKKVVLVYPIPEVGYDVPTTLARLTLTGQDINGFTRPAEYYRARQDVVFKAFDGAGSLERILRIYPNERICDVKECIVSVKGKPLYRDDDHLSLSGTEFIAPLLEPIFSLSEN